MEPVPIPATSGKLPAELLACDDGLFGHRIVDAIKERDSYRAKYRALQLQIGAMALMTTPQYKDIVARVDNQYALHHGTALNHQPRSILWWIAESNDSEVVDFCHAQFHRSEAINYRFISQQDDLNSYVHHKAASLGVKRLWSHASGEELHETMDAFPRIDYFDSYYAAIKNVDGYFTPYYEDEGTAIHVSGTAHSPHSELDLRHAHYLQSVILHERIHQTAYMTGGSYTPWGYDGNHPQRWLEEALAEIATLMSMPAHAKLSPESVAMNHPIHGPYHDERMLLYYMLQDRQYPVSDMRLMFDVMLGGDKSRNAKRYITQMIGLFATNQLGITCSSITESARTVGEAYESANEDQREHELTQRWIATITGASQ